MNRSQNKIKQVLSLLLAVVYTVVIAFYGTMHRHERPMVASGAYQDNEKVYVSKDKLSPKEHCLSCVFSQTGISTLPSHFSYPILQEEIRGAKDLFFLSLNFFRYDEVSTSRGPPVFC